MKFNLLGGGTVEATSPADLVESLRADTATWQPTADRALWMTNFAYRAKLQTGKGVSTYDDFQFVRDLIYAGLVIPDQEADLNQRIEFMAASLRELLPPWESSITRMPGSDTQWLAVIEAPQKIRPKGVGFRSELQFGDSHLMSPNAVFAIVSEIILKAQRQAMQANTEDEAALAGADQE